MPVTCGTVALLTLAVFIKILRAMAQGRNINESTIAEGS
jgi:hypothetical protein